MPLLRARYTVTEFKDFFFFFPIHQSWRSATEGHIGKTLIHCSQRNQKLTPGDAGPKPNALRPLLNRHETPLLCWKNRKTLPKTSCQTVLAPLEEVEFGERVPLQSPRFTCCRKCAILVLFVEPFSLCIDFRNSVRAAADSLSSLSGKWDTGTEVFSLSGVKLDCLVSKETPNYENLQRRNSPSVLVFKRTTQNLHCFSCLSDHTTYMQTSTVMNL